MQKHIITLFLTNYRLTTCERGQPTKVLRRCAVELYLDQIIVLLCSNSEIVGNKQKLLKLSLSVSVNWGYTDPCRATKKTGGNMTVLQEVCGKAAFKGNSALYKKS